MNWLDKLKQYAPDIAMAVASGGATLPQLALKAVADATGAGSIPTVGELEGVVQAADPEEMLRIQHANNAFKTRMAELGNELTRVELADVQHARESHKHSKMPATLCIMLSVMVSVCLWALFTQTIPGANSQIIYLVIGQVITLWAGSCVYFIGTTRSSANKTMMMGKMT